MKKTLLLVASLFFGFANAQEVDENGYTTVEIAMQPAYANQVYFKLSDNTTNTAPAASWDLAFQKAAGMSIGSIRVNDYRTSAIYEAGATTEWATIDVANEGDWTQVYNSATSWDAGAFNEGSAGYGWGEYNLNGDHHVNGTVVFVLKYSATNYKKVVIEDLNTQTAGGPTYTIKSSTWDGTAWSADVTSTVQTPSAASSTTAFTYLSFDSNTTVDVAPVDTAWDFVFSKYDDLVSMGGTSMMYDVTGALSNNLSVAAVEEAGTIVDFTLPADDAYTTDINAIGDKWKSFTGGAYTIPEKTYYIKTDDDKVYRLFFLSFAGTATGNLSFKYKEVTPTAGIEDFANNSSFAIYPNPTANKNVTVALNNITEKATVSVYSITGAKVFETTLTANAQELNLSTLNSGIYLVRVEAGNNAEVKRLVIQ